VSTALYLLRCKQLGLTMEELDSLENGMVWDMITELDNDNYKYPIKAGQKEFHEFLGG
jgi:hypothetical protein